jgi:hypothetical protein
MKKSNFIWMDTNEEMNNPVYETRQWIATRNIELSRRELLDAIAKAIYDYRGKILYKAGHGSRVWPVPDVYEVFGGIDGRWISYYRKEVDGRPRHKPRPSTLERRRLISLFFQIRHRPIWKHFKR